MDVIGWMFIIYYLSFENLVPMNALDILLSERS